MPLLFSYGTLRQESVQLSTFGRPLKGYPDQLIGFAHSVVTIADEQFVATSGKAQHSIVKFTGDPDSRLDGTVLEVSEQELALADSYEPEGYERVLTVLASGKQAWVYAESRG